MSFEETLRKATVKDAVTMTMAMLMGDENPSNREELAEALSVVTKIGISAILEKEEILSTLSKADYRKETRPCSTSN